MTYEGTLLTDALQAAIVRDTLKQSGIEADAAAAESPIRIKNGKNQKGQRIHYFLNYSSSPASIDYHYGIAHNLLDRQQQLSPGQRLTIGPWDVVIAEEAQP